MFTCILLHSLQGDMTITIDTKPITLLFERNRNEQLDKNFVGQSGSDRTFEGAF